jgi:hypothetical protein
VASKPYVIYVIIGGLIGVITAQAHEPITTKLTWTQEISRIIYKRCASCHHDGGSAFSIMTYDDARPWAKAMREEVLERRMPPWGAVEGVGVFRENPSLTALEIEMMVSWVEGGAPEGDAVYLPPKPEFVPGPTKAQRPHPEPHWVVVSGERLTLKEAVTAVAITPRDLVNGASMEVTAYKPDGSVEHLIWLRNYREQWARTYWFRDPIPLPAGTSLVVNTTAPGSAVISVSRR